MAANDPVLERIATYPWPRGGVQACRVRGGYTQYGSVKPLSELPDGPPQAVCATPPGT